LIFSYLVFSEKQGWALKSAFGDFSNDNVTYF